MTVNEVITALSRIPPAQRDNIDVRDANGIPFVNIDVAVDKSALSLMTDNPPPQTITRYVRLT